VRAVVGVKQLGQVRQLGLRVGLNQRLVKTEGWIEPIIGLRADVSEQMKVCAAPERPE
jgi:hypothetical protein